MTFVSHAACLLAVPSSLRCSTCPSPSRPKAEYVRKATRSETARAILASARAADPRREVVLRRAVRQHRPATGSTAAYPPEKGVDLKASYVGKDGAKFGWKPVPGLPARQGLQLPQAVPAAAGRRGRLPVPRVRVDRGVQAPAVARQRRHADACSSTASSCCTRTTTGRPPRTSTAVELKVKAGNEPAAHQGRPVRRRVGGVRQPGAARPIVPASIRKRLDRDFPPPAEVAARRVRRAGRGAATTR